jgi:hypothetical protein
MLVEIRLCQLPLDEKGPKGINKVSEVIKQGRSRSIWGL